MDNKKTEFKIAVPSRSGDQKIIAFVPVWDDNLCDHVFIPVKESDDRERRIKIKSGGEHEEGYSYTLETYWYEDRLIYHESITDSRDCDGTFLHFSSYVWDKGNQEWEKLDGSQRDYSAEAMGY